VLLLFDRLLELPFALSLFGVDSVSVEYSPDMSSGISGSMGGSFVVLWFGLHSEISISLSSSLSAAANEHGDCMATGTL